MGSNGEVTLGPLVLDGADVGALTGFLLERLEENTWKGGGRWLANGGDRIWSGVWIQEIPPHPIPKDSSGPIL